MRLCTTPHMWQAEKVAGRQLHVPVPATWRPRYLPTSLATTPTRSRPRAGNFEFGITRVLRALEPLGANLDAPRWHGAKLCLVAMLDQMAKQMLVLKASGAVGTAGQRWAVAVRGFQLNGLARAVAFVLQSHMAAKSKGVPPKTHTHTYTPAGRAGG